jgi:uncharacterized membrane protein YeiH
MHEFTLLYCFDLFGTCVFAISGALAAGQKRMDIFGAAALGTVTAVGGGSLRDILLNQNVFWIINPTYLYIAVIASMITYFAARKFSIPKKVLLLSDAIGLAVFTVIGVSKTLKFSDSFYVVIIMGIMTGVVGGMIRDILSNEVPLVLRKEIYATAALLGAAVYVAMYNSQIPQSLCIVAGAMITLVCRLAAIFFNWSLPIIRHS